MKNKPIHDVMARSAWRATRYRCDFCHVTESKVKWPGLVCHHIIRRSRSDEPTNLMLVCNDCHLCAHNYKVAGDDGICLPQLTLGMQLAVKKATDPDQYDYGRLCELAHENLPELEALPAWFVEQRKRN